MEVLDDTSPEVRRFMLEANRRATPGERIVRAFDLVHLSRTLALEFLRNQHPDATEPQWRRLVARRFLDRELADAVVEDLDRRGL